MSGSLARAPKARKSKPRKENDPEVLIKGDPEVAKFVLADLATSGITDTEAIESLKLVAYTASETRERIGAEVRSYSFPYFLPDGSPLTYGMKGYRITDGGGSRVPDGGKGFPFYRYKLLDEVRDKDGKLVKYLQDKGSKAHFYMPPLPNVEWDRADYSYIDVSELGPSGSVNVTFCEGEKKSIAAMLQLGGYVIGLGGVNSWDCEELELFSWFGCKVEICFDADQSYGMKPQVYAAACKFALRLKELGADDVKIVQLPGRDGEKVGLDDWLVNCATVAEARAAYAGLPRFFPATYQQLIDFNKEVTYIETPSGYYWENDGKLRNRKALKEAAEERSVMLYRGLSKKNNLPLPSKPEPLVDVWARSPLKARARSLTWLPGEKHGLLPDGTFNSFDPSKMIKPAKGLPGALDTYFAIMDRLWGSGQKSERDYLECLVAYHLLYPDRKLPIAAVVIGMQGSAKTLLARDGYSKLFEPYAISDILGDRLFAKFNVLTAQKLFTCVDEMHQDDKRRDEAVMKKLFDQKMATVEQKGIDSYQVPDFNFYYITSNDPAPFFVAADDRRLFMTQVRDAAPDTALTGAFIKDLEKPEVQGALAYHLEKHLKRFPNFDPYAGAMMTDAKRKAIGLSRTENESFIESLRDNVDEFWVVHGSDGVRKPNPSDLGTAAEVLNAYRIWMVRQSRLTPIGTNTTVIAKALSRRGFAYRDQVYLGNNQKTHLWAIRNSDSWKKQPPTEWAKHYIKNVLEGKPPLKLIEGGRTAQDDVNKSQGDKF